VRVVCWEKELKTLVKMPLKKYGYLIGQDGYLSANIKNFMTALSKFMHLNGQSRVNGAEWTSNLILQ
jgi:hypothetical protein